MAGDDRAAKRVALVREILVGAAGASLDIAGVAVLDGVWSVVKAALAPITTRLSARLGTGDVTASKELAERAAHEFERDQLLQDAFRSELVLATDALLRQGADIGGNVSFLCDLVADNTRRLDEIAGDVHEIKGQLDAGVSLSPEARRDLLAEFEKLLQPVHATESFADAQLGGAREQAFPDESLAEIVATVERAQYEAMRLLGVGERDAALALLEPVRLLLAAALRGAPTSFQLKVLLGYVFKDEAQATSDPDERDRYLEQAADAFGLVVADAPPDPALAADFAGAVNGLGNVYAERGQYERAIAQYRIAVDVAPSYAYAWHDLFAALDARASDGHLDLGAMQSAYANLERSAGPYPNLDPPYLEGLHQRLEQWAASA
jgi:tetratricopeptide (TPR) repeat protein